jgi:hypothetical protein
MMQNGLEDAAKLKFSMELDELRALELRAEAADLYRHSINHTLQAFEFAREATILKQNIRNETNDVNQLQIEEEQDEEEANRDSQEASLWAIRNYGDNLASMGSSTTGHELAKLALQEHEMADVHSKNADAKLQEGSTRLRVAREQVEIARQNEDVKANAEASYGICRIFPFACSVVSSRTTTDNDETGAYSSAPAQPSDESIRANKAVQDALREINEAKVERDVAMELYKNSSLHSNASAQLLHEAQLFHDQAEYDEAESIAYRDEARDFASEASLDKELIKEEQEKIQIEQTEMNKYVNESRSVLNLAISEHRRASATANAMEGKMAQVRAVEELWGLKMVEAHRHVAKAGWCGLVSAVAAVCLLLLVVVRIVGTFRYSRPLLWVVRDPPHRTHDILYLINHIFIMVLAMGFVGELLLHFREEKTSAKIAITMLFALVAAIFQVTLLHFLPHTFRLFGQSDLQTGNVYVLLHEDVVKKGTVVFLLCAMEMLLIWIIFGTIVFHRAYKWDNWWVWIIVVSLAASYGVFLRKHGYIYDQQYVDTSNYLDVFDSARSGYSDEPSMTRGKEDESERRALLSPSNISDAQMDGVINMSSASSSGIINDSLRTSIASHASRMEIHNNLHSSVGEPSPDRSQSLNSVPLGSEDKSPSDGSAGYGSLIADNDRFRYISNTHPEIHSTFIVSWKSEFEKLRLMLEILLVCWSIWVVQNSITLIVKLSPLASDVAWGRCPLWILNIFLLVALVCFGVWYTRQRQKR